MAPSDLNNTKQDAFSKWRPLYHLIAPQGWLNDPCAPCYDASTGKYHLGFQWSPDSWDWGNIAWGAATSQDLVNWTVSDAPSIAPSPTEDPAGVFTGAISPVSLPREGSQNHLTCFYTSAQGSNIHYTKPYERGSEALRAATSVDSGMSWQRHQDFILPGPPEHLPVTGWRDPYMFRWDRMDIARGYKPGSNLYGIISGGIRDKSPTVFLYMVDEADPTKWTFVSTLLELGLQFAPTLLGGDLGVNWEVANIVTLKDQDHDEFDVLIVGVEGCKVTEEECTAISKPVTRSARSGRSQKWLCGDVKQSTQTVEPKMEHRFSGVLDWGMFYAANSFYDPVSEAQVVHGWVLEEDLDDELREAQGWSGFISLPRTLSMQTIKSVDPCCIPALNQVPGFAYRDDGHGGMNVSTICCQPHPHLKTLRRGESSHLNSLASLSGLSEACDVQDKGVQLPGLPGFELEMSMSLDTDVETIGIDIFHSIDREAYTRILLQPSESLITIERSQSRRTDVVKPIKLDDEIAHHAFLTLRDSITSATKPENLEIRIFFDVSVFEVFVNSRTVLTTRVYPNSGRCFGVVPFVVDSKNTKSRTQLERLRVWALKPST
ncbi:Arabinanase/levansucrase/invertase [Aureobasidium subglaciale]|nr:Arabinanase/levansucrase/invertase [Aureobasidium subglaciale]